ncbi:MAG TPA: hypothetical protein VGR19_05425 [Allosphingosinicella sp.]|nr:hypothetical protein [Allosphingosinicella sp.]
MLRVVKEDKAEWEQKCRWARAQGLPPPDQLPHPDHVTFCYETGLIQINGPATPEAKEAWESVKSELRVSEQGIEAARAYLERTEHRAEDKHLLRKAHAYHRKLLALVPAGWNWREQL